MGAEGGLYLAGEDDDLVDRSSSLVLQELADDDTTKRAGPSDGEIFVPGHDRWLLLQIRIMRLQFLFFCLPRFFLVGSN